MDIPGGAGTGSSAGGPPPPAGAVVVPVGVEAAAAPAAPAAAAGGSAWARARARVTWPGAAPPAGAARPAWTRLSRRLAWTAALFLLGLAAAGLAIFAMTLPLAERDYSRHGVLGKAACGAPQTDAEAVRLRTEAEYLLLAASAQVLAATMGLVVPAPPVAFFGSLLGWLTAYRAADVLWMMLVACHGGAHGALAFHFWLFFFVMCAALVVGFLVSSSPSAEP